MPKNFQNEKRPQVPERVAPGTEFNQTEATKDQHKYKRDQHITLDPRENGRM